MLAQDKMKVGYWRSHYAQGGREAIRKDKSRPGRIAPLPKRSRSRIIQLTLREKPSGATPSSRTSLARKVGVRPSSVGRVSATHGWKPPRTRTCKLSNDQHFEEKLEDRGGGGEYGGWRVGEPALFAALNRPMGPSSEAAWKSSALRNGFSFSICGAKARLGESRFTSFATMTPRISMRRSTPGRSATRDSIFTSLRRAHRGGTWLNGSCANLPSTARRGVCRRGVLRNVAELTEAVGKHIATQNSNPLVGRRVRHFRKGQKGTAKTQ